MMIGVTSAEAFVLLNSVEMELGLESETRNKLVSDLVTLEHHSTIYALELQIKAKRRFAKISKSRRRHLLVLSNLSHYKTLY